MADRMSMLNMQLPSTSPSAMSGSEYSAVALNPVKSSGKLVVAASSTTPIQLAPSPLFSPHHIAASRKTHACQDDHGRSQRELQEDHERTLVKMSGFSIRVTLVRPRLATRAFP
jgi:hypothetical protein